MSSYTFEITYENNEPSTLMSNKYKYIITE